MDVRMSPPPGLGPDNEAVYGELGLSVTELASLESAGVI